MNLGDIFKRYILGEKDSGMLSIKFDGIDHLLKIYLDDKGDVVYITFGTCKNEECLEKVRGLKPSEHFFLKGVKPPSTSGLPLTEKVLALADIETSGTTTSISKEYISPEVLKNIENEFVDIIGPIGKVIIDNLYSRLSYKRGDKMRGDDFATFIESLIKELPPQEQSKFSSRYKFKI